MSRNTPRPFRPSPKFAAPASKAAPARRAPEPRPHGALPPGRAPLILTVDPSADYALLDSGDGLKLERFGRLTIARPEGQAIWRPALPDAAWQKADAVFTGDTDEEGVGRWKLKDASRGETFALSHDGLSYFGRFTSFRHVGVFPEQAPHWAHMEALIKAAKRPVKVLNLFGYTGLASLIAARAGAEVTHVDASKKAIGWARENQAVAGLQAARIRWICDDAMVFLEREGRRASTYDIILADPPAYGRGPNGEVWQLFEDLPHLVARCRDVLTPAPLAFVLTAYSIRASFYALHALMRDAFAGRGGEVQSGELVITEESAGRALSTSLFSRWVATP
jgi:23S rRNA (cytosine1962-C5)-methyltransferase